MCLIVINLLFLFFNNDIFPMFIMIIMIYFENKEQIFHFRIHKR